MKESPQGLVPATGFMDEAMRPRPSFNDGSICGTYAYLSIQFIFSECEPREIKKGASKRQMKSYRCRAELVQASEILTLLASASQV